LLPCYFSADLWLFGDVIVCDRDRHPNRELATRAISLTGDRNSQTESSPANPATPPRPPRDSETKPVGVPHLRHSPGACGVSDHWNQSLAALLAIVGVSRRLAVTSLFGGGS